MNPALVALAAAAGSAAGSLLACVPGLHVYNALGLLVLALHRSGLAGDTAVAGAVVPLAAGMLVGSSLANTIPSVLLGAPDESAFFTVLPGQKYLMAGRGRDAVLLTAVGGAGGLFALLAAGLALPRVLPVVRAVTGPHLHWMLWCVIAFMLMSEWPKEGLRGPAGWPRFREAWRGLGAGLLTFLLSGLLGLLLFFRSPVPAGAALFSLTPAFVGLFTVPWLLLNLLTRVRAPPQRTGGEPALDPLTAARGIAAGTLGGGFAAFMPAVTGGVGGFLAGHAAALRDDRAFLVSQGASKMVYYAGGLLLFFVPGCGLTRGGAAWMLSGLRTGRTLAEYWMTLAAMAMAGAVALALVDPLTRAGLALIERCGYRRLSAAALAVVVALVAVMTGWPGLLVAAVSTAIGLLPLLYGSRRMNALGVILLPVACQMSGVGTAVADVLGIL